MQRRDFLKQAAATTAAVAITPGASEQSYESATISVLLREEKPGVSSIYLTEHGDADEVVIQAFYWTTIPYPAQTRIMLHAEATTMLVKGATVATELLLPLANIVFIRVKEMRMLNQSEFGQVPNGYAR
jgi:anaerobic selenocysteine-containing dehydrogenase